ncbi:phosphoribosyltransferase family protein [Fodinicola acaciae]|uniref:phosphoribosyltransferase family protein n=1 Tax=Fodinicola acaciae TaxID=2681555 RepID=UPI001C9E9D88|nr:phosphoribosyltransferase family protein [Fodinicola acaciae]
MADAVFPESDWSGTWVSDRLGVRLRTTAGRALHDLLGLAVRRNPKRAHLLVSTILGKHVPTDPRAVHGAGVELGELVARELTGPAVVIGNAETATALGHCVAEALGAPYLHSTRRPIDGVEPYGGFAEAHSHATDHLLLPTEPSVLAALNDPATTVVLVDDELSTGATALGTIAELDRLAPHRSYLLASLVDVRSEADKARAGEVRSVSLSSGVVELPDGVLEAGQRLVAEMTTPSPVLASSKAFERVQVEWDAPVGGRQGITAAGTSQLGACADLVGKTIAGQLSGAESVLVLGFEELMYAPLLIASAMTEALPGVRYSTTTRSPVLAVDDPGYAIRTSLSFPSHDDPADGPGARFAYNVRPCDAIVLVVDAPADTPALHHGLLAQLTALADRVLLVVI